MKKNAKKKILVNAITSTRLIAAAFMLPIYFTFGGFITAITAGLVFLTDCIDGFLARHLHVQSFFGSILDSVSDKVLGITIFSILAIVNPIFLLPILFELGIVIVNVISIARGNNVKTSIAGKIKANVLDISVVIGLISLSLSDILLYIDNSFLAKMAKYNSNQILYYLCIPLLASECVVIIDYIYKAIKQEKQKSSDQIEVNTEKKRLKNKQELFNALFDTNYFLEHRNDGIKNLLFTIEE